MVPYCLGSDVMLLRLASLTGIRLIAGREKFNTMSLKTSLSLAYNRNNRNNRTRCEICPKLTIKIPERRQWRRSSVFIVNLGYISHLVLVFLLLILR